MSEKETGKGNSNSTIELFDCEIHLAGSAMHSVPKKGVSSMEMDVVRQIHGEDSVRQIKPAGNRPAAAQREEFFRLAWTYNKAAVKAAFPTANMNGFDEWLEETLELERMDREEKAQQRQQSLNQKVAA